VRTPVAQVARNVEIKRVLPRRDALGSNALPWAVLGHLGARAGQFGDTAGMIPVPIVPFTLVLFGATFIPIGIYGITVGGPLALISGGAFVVFGAIALLSGIAIRRSGSDWLHNAPTHGAVSPANLKPDPTDDSPLPAFITSATGHFPAATEDQSRPGRRTSDPGAKVRADRRLALVTGRRPATTTAA